MLVDTHCHLGDPAFDDDRDAVVARMLDAGVGGAVVVESDLARLDATTRWLEGRPQLRLVTGCHPHDARHWSPGMAARLAACWRHPTIGAAGEMGLDYHYDHSPRDLQRTAFDAQVGMATDAGLAVVIHAREADDDVVAVLQHHPRATVVLHSFSSGPALRRAGLERGWYFSFSGMVTFRSWQQDDTVRAVAVDRLLLETDAPYLAPVPHRGRRNEPAYVREVAARVAAVRGVTFDDLVASTGGNARRVFWRDVTVSSPEE